MSGEPPNGFEIHCSDDGADIITAREFSDEIRDWLGVEGILDMRAYVRFRFLDYFKNHRLPDGLKHIPKPAVSEEEMTINTLIIDFALKQKYYFTLCLLISEIQAFSKFDERVKPLLTHISTMSTDDMENLTPLLDSEQVSRVLRAFNIDPRSENGLNIHQAYQRNEKRQSLIQLVMSYNNGNNSDAAKRSVETDNYLSNATVDEGKYFNALIESFTNQITQVNRKMKQIELKFSHSGLGMIHKRRIKATEDEVKRFKGKFSDVSKAVEDMRSSVQVLMELVDHTRMQGQVALQRCSPYIGHIFSMTSRLGRIEVAVRRIKRKLTAQGNQSKVRAIRSCNSFKTESRNSTGNSESSLPRSFSFPFKSRRCLKIRQVTTEDCNSTRINTANVLDKTVQTEKCSDKDSLLPENYDKTKHGVAIQTSPVLIVDAHTQSDSQHQYANTEMMRSMTFSNDSASRGKYFNGNLLEIPEKQSKQEEDDDTGIAKEKRQDNSVQTVMSSFRGQDTPVVMEQNYELRGKVLEQSRRIHYLTIRIAELHADLAEKEMAEQTYRTWLGTTRTDASTNTDDYKIIQTTSVTCKTDGTLELKDKRKIPRFKSDPLKKALWTAKVEIAALKQERRNIQDRSQSNY